MLNQRAVLYLMELMNMKPHTFISTRRLRTQCRSSSPYLTHKLITPQLNRNMKFQNSKQNNNKTNNRLHLSKLVMNHQQILQASQLSLAPASIYALTVPSDLCAPQTPLFWSSNTKQSCTSIPGFDAAKPKICQCSAYPSNPKLL